MGEVLMFSLKDCPRMGIGGILCTEAASGYWGLSSYDYNTFPIFMFEVISGRIARITGNISYLGIPEKISFENTIPLGNSIYVTNKIRTVCDMIRYESDVFHTLETVYNFYCYEGEEEIIKLEREASKRGILEKLHELRETAEEDFEGE